MVTIVYIILLYKKVTNEVPTEQLKRSRATSTCALPVFDGRRKRHKLKDEESAKGQKSKGGDYTSKMFKEK